jgi:hypothetical protein
MFKSATAKSITALAVSVVGGLTVFLTSVVPEARAEAQLQDTFHQPLAKGDRLPLAVIAKGAACSSRGWPHYEQSCQFDLTRPANEARTVRIIALR